MSDITLKWVGPINFSTMLQDIPEKEGVYLWLFDLWEEQRLHYIGSAANLKERQAQHIEMTLGGGYFLMNLDKKDESEWLPEELKDNNIVNRRVWRIQQFIQDSKYRELAYRTIHSVKFFYALTDRCREVERELLEIAFKKADKKYNDSRFLWLGNSGLQGTVKSEQPLEIKHDEPNEKKIIGKLFEKIDEI